MSDDAGVSATAVVLLVAMLVLGVAGISIDLWRALAVHRDLVALADGAATAGATALDTAAIYADATDLVLDPDEARRRACDHLELRPEGPRCGPGASVVVTPGTVTVTLSDDVELTLLRLLTGDAGSGPLRIGVESTAVLLRESAP